MQQATSTSNLDSASADPSARVADSVDQSLIELARSLASGAAQTGNVTTVFGAPVKLDTHTVVPVANVTIGAGGGGVRSLGAAFDVVRGLLGLRKVTQRAPSHSLAGGGGLGIHVQPIGFLHEEDGRVVFTSIEVATAR